MKIESLKSQLNNEKGQLFNEKITKSAASFRKNKANLSEDKFGAKHFSIRIYERFHPLPKRKNKPNQTQFGADKGPLKAKQTQFKPKSNPISKAHKRTKTMAGK